jgi:hypothetical protein
MAGERRLNWGADATDAQYRTGDDAANNRFILAEDLDGGTILLEYDETASEWVSRGPVNMSGNDVLNVGTLSATAVNTEDLDIGTADFVSDGDFIGVGISWNSDTQLSLSTSTSTYTTDIAFFRGFGVWDDWVPSDANPAIYTFVRGGASSLDKDVRLRNTTDGETVWEETGLSGGYQISRFDEYTPTTTGQESEYNIEIRDNDGGGADIFNVQAVLGVQL